MSEKVICAFLDLLGFKSFLKEDFSGALKLINNYQFILSWMKENEKVKSFNNLVPFSDSIFISSKDNYDFFTELSDFIKSSFQYVATTYPISKNKQKPFDVTIAVGSLTEDKKVIFKHEPEKWYPPLFRGGATYDELKELPTLVINNDKVIPINNLFGNAVVQAYLLEQKTKGPRIIIDSSILSLNKINKSLIFKSFDNPDFFELYWPLWNCDYEDVDFSFNNEIVELLERAILLWKAFNHQEVSLQYYNFIKLITKGFILFYENDPIKLRRAKENISSYLEVYDILDKKDDLL
jgi:hypothetical protein